MQQLREVHAVRQDGQGVACFSMSCAPCCARLVKSARPLRTAQDAMLYAITRRRGRPTRSDVLQTLKALDAASAPRS